MFSRTAALAAAVAVTTEAARFSRTDKGDGFDMYEGKPLIELKPCEQAEFDALNQMLEERECIVLADYVSLPKDGSCVDTTAICKEAGDAKDLTMRFQDSVTLVADDAANFFRAASGGVKTYQQPRAGEADAFYSAWRGLADKNARVRSLVAASGGVATMSVFGKSFEGADIEAVTFRGAGYTPSSGKRAVLTFNLHAREWIAGMAGVYAVEYLIQRVAADPAFIAGTEVVIVPMANPDGFVRSETQDRFHRKNTNGGANSWNCRGGIDLNRNFRSHWAMGGSSGNRCSDAYHGPSAESEPETQAITELIEAAPVNVVIDVHSYTQLVLAPYGYTRNEHPRAAEHAVLGEAMRSAMQARHGARYLYGPGAQMLYPASGILPDFVADLGALGYCYELRPRAMQGLSGFAPPASEILPTAEECFDGLILAIEYARDN